jgi:hypothetical protein
VHLENLFLTLKYVPHDPAADHEFNANEKQSVHFLFYFISTHNFISKVISSDELSEPIVNITFLPSFLSHCHDLGLITLNYISRED